VESARGYARPQPYCKEFGGENSHKYQEPQMPQQPEFGGYQTYDSITLSFNITLNSNTCLESHTLFSLFSRTILSPFSAIVVSIFQAIGYRIPVGY